MSRRLLALLVLGAAATALPALYLWRAHRAAQAPSAAAASAPLPAAGALALPPAAVAFRFTGAGDAYGHLVSGRLGAPRAAQVASELRCDRLALAAGRGICLVAHRGVFTRYEAIVFDAAFRPLHTLPLSGEPSRTRVSRDGRLGAVTVFESGHSYAADAFSTRTSILDLERGELIEPDLERFTVMQDGERIDAVDMNFWGVTFTADSERFYATLATGGRTYLVEGDVGARRMRVLRPDVECPALSPDGSRLAFKRREGGELGPMHWRLSVLRLDTLEEWPLAELRSVDDQAEWLDDQTVLYALPAAASGSAVTNTWAVPADGSGTPQLALPESASLVVVR